MVIYRMGVRVEDGRGDIMALLDFKCKDCNEKFFEIVSSSNRDKVACPKCGSRNVGQVFEGPSNFGTSSGKSAPAPRGGG